MSNDLVDSGIDDDDWFVDEVRIDPWAWAHDDPDEAGPLHSGDEVLAVLVTRNASGWLQRVLRGLDSLTVRPDRIIAIDNESTDDTSTMLAEALDRGVIDALFQGDVAWGFGDAISSALVLDAKDHPVDTPPTWLWLLHDDAVPMPDALDRQLERGESAPDVGMVVPLLLQATRRGADRLISELGSSVTATGLRELLLGQGDLDQGQHESQSVLGGSSCGVLVRRRVWDELAGFDPRIPILRDGQEFGWRVNLAGHRVVTAPTARFTHRQASRAELRPGVEHPTATDRAYGMMLATAHLRGFKRFYVPLWIVLTALFRSLGFLIGKAPRRAADELRALGMYFRSGRRVRRLRGSIARIDASSESRARVRVLLPKWNAALSQASSAVASAVGDRWVETFGSLGEDTSLDDLTGDDFAGGNGTTVRRRPWLLPTTIIFAALFVCAVVAARSILMGAGHLSSVHLLPAPEDLGALYRSYTTPIPGAPMEVAPPWVGLVALLSTFFLGQPELFISFLVIFSVPLTALAGYGFLRRVCNDRRARIVGAVLYGILPSLLGAVTRGQLGILVWGMVVPLLGMSILGWRRRGTSGQDSWRGAFSVALALTVLASFTPLVLLFALVVGVGAIIRLRHGGQTRRILIALLVPVLMLSPWLPTLLAHPGRILTGEDPVLDGMQVTDGAMLFLGRTAGAGLPPMWLSIVIFAGIWLMALIGVVLRPSSVRPWVLTGIGSLAFAVVLTKLVVVVPPGASGARPAAGLWLLLAFGALIAAAAIGFEGVARRLSQQSFGIWQGLSLLALAAAVVVSMLGLGWFVKDGLGAPMHRAPVSAVPSHARNAMMNDFQPRALVIDLADAANPRWELQEGDGTRLGDGERGGALGGQATPIGEARSVVADISTGRSDAGVAESLRQLGVGYLVVKHGSVDHMAAISSIPGLGTSTGDESTRIWRVSAQPARAHLVASDQTVSIAASGTTIKPGPATRELVLDEPVDKRWVATLDGVVLEPVLKDDDYRQRFVVGERGGLLEYHLASTIWWPWLQLLGLLVLLVLAAPSLRRTESRDPALYARRAAREEVTE